MNQDHFPTPAEAAELDKIFGEVMSGPTITLTEQRLREARLIDDNRKLWLMSMKIALLVIGAAIVVIGVTLSLALR